MSVIVLLSVLVPLSSSLSISLFFDDGSPNGDIDGNGDNTSGVTVMATEFQLTERVT